jgi:hypothetical protein
VKLGPMLWSRFGRYFPIFAKTAFFKSQYTFSKKILQNLNIT